MVVAVAITPFSPLWIIHFSKLKPAQRSSQPSVLRFREASRAQDSCCGGGVSQQQPCGYRTGPGRSGRPGHIGSRARIEEQLVGGSRRAQAAKADLAAGQTRRPCFGHDRFVLKLDIAQLKQRIQPDTQSRSPQQQCAQAMYNVSSTAPIGLAPSRTTRLQASKHQHKQQLSSLLWTQRCLGSIG